MNQKKIIKSTSGLVLLFFCLLLLAVLTVSCKEEIEPVEDDGSSPETSENMVDAVGNNINETVEGMSPDVLSHIKACATSQLVESDLQNSPDAAAVSVAIAIGMMEGLGNFSDDQLSEVANGDPSVQSPNKKKAIAAISATLTSELGEALSGEELNTGVANTIEKLTLNLKTAGITGSDMGAVSKDLTAGGIAGLKASDLDDEALLTASLAVAQSAITGLGDKTNGLSDDELQTAVQEAVCGVVSALGNAGVPQDSIVTKMSDIINAAATGVGESDARSEQYSDLVDAIKDGFATGLQESGMSNIELNSIYSDIGTACNTALSDLIDNYPDPIESDSLIDDIHAGLAFIDSATGLTLTDSQRSSVKSNLQAAISNAGLSDSEDLEELIPIIIEQAARSVNGLTPPLSDEEKIDSFRNILETCEAYLSGKVSGDDALELLERIGESSIAYLDQLGLATSAYDTATEKIAYSLTKSLDEIPLGTASMEDAVTTIVGAIVGTSDALGLSEPDDLGVIQAAVNGAVTGIGENDLNTEDLNKLIAKTGETAAEKAVQNQIDAGKTGTELANTVDDIAKSITDGLLEAGVPTSDCADLADDIINGAANELASVLSTDELSDALTNAGNGIVSGMQEAGAGTDEMSEAESAASDAADEAVTNAADPTQPRIIISDENLTTEEGSDERGNFKVSLDKKPSSNVTVDIESKDTTEGTVSPSNLVFTSSNWNAEQTVFIIPVDEGYVDGEVEYKIVVKTDGGARKTLKVTNMDDDEVGIKVTPTSKQYASEVGGQAWYYVNLTSQPTDTIRLRWAIVFGQSSVFFPSGDYRIMDFTTSNYNVPQLMIVQGKECSDCDEHTSVSLESQNIISINKTDTDYPNLTPESISLVNLKGGPKIMTTDAVSNSQVKVTFDSSYVNFSNTNDNYIYETVFATESVSFTYAEYQSRPLLIKEDDCFGDDDDNAVDVDVDYAPIGDPLATDSFTFCLKFYNANTGYTSTGMSNWATANGFNLDSCSGDGNTPNYVTCSFSGEGSSVPTSTIPKNTIFSNDNIGNESYSLSGSGYHTSPPTIPAEPSYPPVNLGYVPLTISGSNAAEFSADSAMRSGYWYLSDKSKSFVYGGSSYSPSLYFYIYVTP